MCCLCFFSRHMCSVSRLIVLVWFAVTHFGPLGEFPVWPETKNWGKAAIYANSLTKEQWTNVTSPRTSCTKVTSGWLVINMTVINFHMFLCSSVQRWLYLLYVNNRRNSCSVSNCINQINTEIHSGGFTFNQLIFQVSHSINHSLRVTFK